MTHLAPLLVLFVGGLFIFLISLVSLLLYFAPAFVALSRETKHKWVIAVLNLLFGWSLLGWLICLIWAFNDEYPPLVTRTNL